MAQQEQKSGTGGPYIAAIVDDDTRTVEIHPGQRNLVQPLVEGAGGFADASGYTVTVFNRKGEVAGQAEPLAAKDRAQAVLAEKMSANRGSRTFGMSEKAKGNWDAIFRPQPVKPQ